MTAEEADDHWTEFGDGPDYDDRDDAADHDVIRTLRAQGSTQSAGEG